MIPKALKRGYPAVNFQLAVPADVSRPGSP